MVEENTTWDDNLGRSRNGADQMTHEGEGIYAHAAGMERDVGTAGSKKKNPAAVDACR